MNAKHTSRVESYFKRNLTDKELKQFVSDLENDPELRKVFEEHKLAMDVIDHQAEKELRSKFQEWKNSGRNNIFSSRNIYIGLAASILLLVGIYFYFNRPAKLITTDQLAIEFYVLPTQPESIMGDADEHWFRGADAFGKQLYAQAIDEWIAIEDPGDEVKYYLAHSYFNLREYSESIRLFKELTLSTSVYSYPSEWYLLLTYLIADDTSNFHNQLEQVIKEKNHPYYSDAQELKDRAEKLNSN